MNKMFGVILVIWVILVIFLIKYFICSFNKRNYINLNICINIKVSVVLVFVVLLII